MAVGGIAVRVSLEALSSGSLRVKRNTAEQFFGADKLVVDAQVSISGTAPATCHTLALRIHSSSVQRTPGGGSPPSSTSAHCELCGLGAWLRGQGAVPGVHWVQLWRGAGGALRLRMCAGKPTALPGEEAEAAERRVVAVASHPTVAATNTGTSDRLAEAAAAHAAAQLVGAAAQDVADAAAPWELLPTQSLPKGPAVGRAAAEAVAVHRPIREVGAGQEQPAAVLAAALSPCPSVDKHEETRAPWTLLYGSRAPLVPVQGVRTDSVAASRRAPGGISGVAGAQPPRRKPQPAPQRIDSSLCAAHRPMLPAPPPTTLPSPSPTPAASGPVVHTVLIGPDRLALLGPSALDLWPWAGTLGPGQRRIVVLRTFAPGRGAARHTPEARDMTATVFRIDGGTWALEGTGMRVRFADTLRLAQGPDGKVWAWLQRQSQQQHQRQENPQLQQLPQLRLRPQQQQLQPLRERDLNQQQPLLHRRPQLRPSQQQQPPPPQQQLQLRLHGHPQQHLHQQPPQPPRVPAKLHQASTGSGGLPWEGERVGQHEEEEGCDPYRAAKRVKRHERSTRSTGSHANQQHHHGERSRPLQQQQQQDPGTAKPATSQAASLPMPDPNMGVLVGNAWDRCLDVRHAAVETLFPAALGLSSGQAIEVAVYAAAAEGRVGGSRPGQQQQQRLVPFRLRLMFYQRKSCRIWRLRGCGPLFRALGARNRDAIFMRRLPRDSRILVEMEARCWVGSQLQRKARKRGSSRHREEELALSETSGEEEEEVELDDGDSGDEEGHGGDGGEEETDGDGDLEGEEERAGAVCGASGIGRVVGGRARQGSDAVASTGGRWEGRADAGAGRDEGGEEEGGENGAEEEDDQGYNCWLPAGAGEGGLCEEGGEEAAVDE